MAIRGTEIVENDTVALQLLEHQVCVRAKVFTTHLSLGDLLPTPSPTLS